jgi:O-antigen/teichoic acid export membrane protein
MTAAEDLAKPASTSGPTASGAPEVPPAASSLMRDAATTVITRFGLAILIFATDIVLARLLGPAAKGRFSLVLLYSQLAALILGWGMDQAIAVVSARGREDARRAMANAIIWTVVVGGFGVVFSAWLYGLGPPGPPDGPLVPVIPNLSAKQFVYSAVAIPGELFFAVGLNAFLGRRLVVSYSWVRLFRRLILLVLIVAMAAIARLSLDITLILNLVALALTGLLSLAIARSNGFLSVRPSWAILLEELRFGSRAVFGSLAERLQFRADAFIVNALLGVVATGIYSVTSGLAETLWYIPNALGIVMFSRAVDPDADAGAVASALTRMTIAVVTVTALPLLLLGPYLVRLVYGSQFADAGVALRFILPGVIAYSVVAVLTRYVTGRGRPGTATLIMGLGLATNIVANLYLVPRLGISGAALSSSISYGLTSILTLAIFLRLSGRGFVETIFIRRSDLRLIRAAGQGVIARVRRRRAVGFELQGGDSAAEFVMGEREPGEEP